MRTLYILGLTILSGIFLFSSCSIEKRLYRPGYNITMNKHKNKKEINEVTENKGQYKEVTQLKIKEYKTSKTSRKLAKTENLNSDSENGGIVLNQTLPEQKKNVQKTSYDNKMYSTEDNLGLSSIIKTKIEKDKKPISILSPQHENLQTSVPSDQSNEMMLLLVILCFLLPFVAVGIVTNWALKPVLISVLLSLLFWVPGIIYALIVVLR
jgi:uncharacterized membrane protein YqaE (UPF0057 family)